jgi:hypothetical protein
MERSKSVGPSERLIRWTEYIFLVGGATVALTQLAMHETFAAAGGTLLFWRALIGLKRLRSPR